ncbi:MAG TPA: hypothetical protein VFI66_00720 [Gemmatimonadales bacterium]|nr:hypothetical protein [Gemmatimonadales bacterium]
MTDLDPGAVGLCASCRWTRRVANRRGSTFFRCGRADTDARFPRYPPLPVSACAGYEAQSDGPAREEPVEHG